MIRFHLLSRLALFAALATYGCGSEPGTAQGEDEVAEAPSIDINGAADEGSELTNGQRDEPTLLPSTLSPSRDVPLSPTPDSTEHLLYGPFPQPWSTRER